MPLGPVALVISSAATALAGFAIARSIGAARSRKARAQLGDPLDRVPETGGAVTLRGKLAAGAPCKRFDDGRDAAATTAASLTAPAEASARAEALVLYVGDTPVRLEGPVYVAAGSREKAVGSNVAPPRGGVVDRISAVDPEIAWVLVNRPSKLRLRALAHGDRVRVSGVLQRSDMPMEGSAKGYRDAGAPWCLVPDASDGRDPPALVAAYEGAPGGPPVRRATIAGASLGALLVAVAAVTAPPSLLKETARAPEPPPSSSAVATSEPWRDRTFDATEKALEEGDFAAAGDAYPQRTAFATQAAELDLIAGRGQRAADLANHRVDANPLVYEKPACLAEALRAYDPAKGRAHAPRSLRDEVNRSEGHARAYCGLLLADFLEGDERAALVRSLPPAGENLTRLRALLLLEAGRVPDAIPRDDGKLPYAGVLLERSPYFFYDAVLAVHITNAIRKHPLAAQIDPRFRAIEAARAAHLLSALGDYFGAVGAWEQAHRDVAHLDARELFALRVAIELRIGNVTEAQRFAANLPADHEMALAAAILGGSTVDPSMLREGTLPHHLRDRATWPRDGAQIAAELMRPGTFDDGQMLFLVAARAEAPRGPLLAWVRTGNRERYRHDAKGPRGPYPPEDFVARLEERRIMARELGDAALAAELGAKLRDARRRILRRDIAAVRYVLHHSSLYE